MASAPPQQPATASVPSTGALIQDGDEVLLSLCVGSDISNRTRAVRQYLNTLFQHGESMDKLDFLELVFTELDNTLRRLADGIRRCGYVEIFTEPLTELLQRTYKRFHNETDAHIKKPFEEFVDRLADFASIDWLTQRLLTNVLVNITAPVTIYIARSWFQSVQDSERRLLPPLVTLLSENGGDWRQTLLYSIPLNTATTSARFWANWTGYVTSDECLAPIVWSEFLNGFLDIKSNISGLIFRAHAFVILACALKPLVKKYPDIVRLTDYLPMVTQLMESILPEVHVIGLVVGTVLFDLDSRRPGREPLKKPPGFECDHHSYERLLSLYQDDESEPEEHPSTSNLVRSSSQNLISNMDSESMDQNVEDLPLDSRVLSLRKAGLVPSSFIDVFKIVTGSTSSSDDLETEALSQLAILWIPILIRAEYSLDKEMICTLAKFLIERDTGGHTEDLCILAIYELCMKYPEIVCIAIADDLPSANYSYGQRLRYVKVLHKVILYAGNLCCTNCFNKENDWERKELVGFAKSFEPLYLSKYLETKTSRCWSCEQMAKKQESSLPPKLEPETTGIKPKSRRWGRRKRDPLVQLTDKKSIHFCMWAAVFRHLEQFSSKCTQTEASSFDLQLALSQLELLKCLVLSYAGISELLHPLILNAVTLVRLYGRSTNLSIRENVWGILNHLIRTGSLYEFLQAHLSESPEVKAELGGLLQLELNDTVLGFMHQVLSMDLQALPWTDYVEPKHQLSNLNL